MKRWQQLVIIYHRTFFLASWFATPHQIPRQIISCGGSKITLFIPTTISHSPQCFLLALQDGKSLLPFGPEDRYSHTSKRKRFYSFVFIYFFSSSMRSSSHFGLSVAYFVCFILLLLAQHFSIAEAQPSPGFYVSSQVAPISFYQGFRNLWGPQHMILQQDTLTVWLDRSSGNVSLLFLLFHILWFYT